MVTVVSKYNLRRGGAVVLSQLTARSLPIPEDPGSNPIIGNFIEQLFTVCRKDENKDKEAHNGPFFKKSTT